MPAPMIVLFTDFGANGPYVGEMKAQLTLGAPGVPVIDLICDAPRFNAKAAAYLLGALAPSFPIGTVFLAVVDPGVGTAERLPAAVMADQRWYVGPGNGLFDVVARRAQICDWQDILWDGKLSPSFHGRDLFAPIAALIARDITFPGKHVSRPARLKPNWPLELPEVIYLDTYGNAWTGLHAGGIATTATVSANGHTLRHARTFGEAPVGQAFWYENSSGMIEIAVNRGRADDTLSLAIGTAVTVNS
jgi:S-adenosylmethionine hydrolase